MSGFTVLGLDRSELAAQLAALGQPAYRAGQVMRWVYGKGARGFAEMTDLPAELRAELARVAEIGRLEVVTVQRAEDGATAKLLLRLADGETVETVLLHHDYGSSVCVSSQVGCAMGCRFCASTREGLVRNLSAGEMLAQVLEAQAEAGEGRRVSHAVVMGMGEPLANLENVLRFLRLLHAPEAFGMSYRNMTVSTSGLIPGIARLAEENLPLTLAVSLHAPNDRLRSELMPVNRRYPLGELIPACAAYAGRTGRRVTFEYAVIAGVNDRPAHARELAGLLRGLLCHVNLIPLNAVPESGFERSSPARVEEFRSILAEAGIPATVRREMGTEIEAACGQLRRRAGKAGGTG
ncbi:MAG TPA: 23S rRNA (adenine(2503)-C(2))-methyltransferase RlmN [Firmicutes bacterium]|nr:23S rRNA (adenine(2503)-C(2))-methyltransferase RlmN [Bacillota bacterium]